MKAEQVDRQFPVICFSNMLCFFMQVPKELLQAFSPESRRKTPQQLHVLNVLQSKLHFTLSKVRLPWTRQENQPVQSSSLYRDVIGETANVSSSPLNHSRVSSPISRSCLLQWWWDSEWRTPGLWLQGGYRTGVNYALNSLILRFRLHSRTARVWL